MNPDEQSSMQVHPSGVWIFLLFGIAYAFAVLFLSQFPHWAVPLAAIVVGSVIVYGLYRSISLAMDFTVLVIPWIFTLYHPDLLFPFYAFMGTAVLVYVSAQRQSRGMLLLAAVYAAGAFTYGFAGDAGVSALALVFPACAAVVIAAGAQSRRQPSGNQPGTIDAIVCSYTGNTAHYFELFRQGLLQTGAGVAVHPFRYHRGFRPELRGGALVIAFPVIGWKMPWPFLLWLVRSLPRGGGKPAFVLYTAAGGPENAGFLGWLLLTLKGYRVRGTAWSAYPNNVTTLRIGPIRFWNWMDRLVPPGGDVRFVREAGEAFARGEASGFPVMFWPSPLFLAGLLVENPFINRIYRHYAWKKRCTGCGLCVRVCPSGRLSLGADGYPRANGACTLCLGCVNLCPANAMHLFLFTEYGHPYKPRWPKLPYWNGGEE